MTNNNDKYWVGLSGVVGLGIKRFQLLRKYFGSVKEMWQASKDQLIATGLDNKIIANWQQQQDKINLDQEMIKMRKKLIKVVTLDGQYYPKLLKEIDFPPLVLYVQGEVKCLQQDSVAVVGSRKMTKYGKQAIEKLVPGLVKEQLVIVSGLARGVDSWGHRVCLGNNGQTVAVLGHGLNRIYPPENKILAKQIVKQQGALITEYPLNYPIKKNNFRARNRIIAGLSLGVLVVEGRHRSGTKITAGFAGDYGRDVWAVPGPIDSKQSEAPADLIKKGAKLVREVDDILEEL